MSSEKTNWQIDIANAVSECLSTFDLVEVTRATANDVQSLLQFTSQEVAGLEPEILDDHFIRVFARRLGDCTLFLNLVVRIIDGGTLGRFQVDARITHMPSIRLFCKLQNLQSSPFEICSLNVGVIQQFFPVTVSQSFDEKAWQINKAGWMSNYRKNLGPVLDWLGQTCNPRSIFLEKYPSLDTSYLQNVYIPLHRLKILERQVRLPEHLLLGGASDFVLGIFAGFSDLIRSQCSRALEDPLLQMDTPKEPWKFDEINRQFISRLTNELNA